MAPPRCLGPPMPKYLTISVNVGSLVAGNFWTLRHPPLSRTGRIYKVIMAEGRVWRWSITSVFMQGMASSGHTDTLEDAKREFAAAPLHHARETMDATGHHRQVAGRGRRRGKHALRQFACAGEAIAQANGIASTQLGVTCGCHLGRLWRHVPPPMRRWISPALRRLAFSGSAK